MKPITLKIDEKQLKLLHVVSKTTHISKSALIRMGIDLVLRQTKEDIISSEIRQEIDRLLSQDHRLLQRLAEA